MTVHILLPFLLSHCHISLQKLDIAPPLVIVTLFMDDLSGLNFVTLSKSVGTKFGYLSVGNMPRNCSRSKLAKRGADDENENDAAVR